MTHGNWEKRTTYLVVGCTLIGGISGFLWSYQYDLAFFPLFAAFGGVAGFSVGTVLGAVLLIAVNLWNYWREK